MQVIYMYKTDDQKQQRENSACEYYWKLRASNTSNTNKANEPDAHLYCSFISETNMRISAIE